MVVFSCSSPNSSETCRFWPIPMWAKESYAWFIINVFPKKGPFSSIPYPWFLDKPWQTHVILLIIYPIHLIISYHIPIEWVVLYRDCINIPVSLDGLLAVTMTSDSRKGFCGMPSGIAKMGEEIKAYRDPAEEVFAVLHGWNLFFCQHDQHGLPSGKLT